MTTATLALSIGALILAQVTAALSFGIYRHQAERRALGSGGSGSGSGSGGGSGVGATLRQSADLGGPRPVPAVPSPRAPAPSWSGYRDFVVQRRVVEDLGGSVRSFYLVPEDGGPLPAYKPGQYLTFKLDVPDPAGGPARSLVRCYSLSDRARSDSYRITVKRVPAPLDRPDLPQGAVSNHFHDCIEEGSRVSVRAPSGHFHLSEEGDLPIVLIAGGIGITPLLSILSTLAHWSDPREVWLFYGVRNGSEHIMKDRLEALKLGHPLLHLHVCYAAPGADDQLGRDYRHEGRLDIALLRRTLPFGRYEFYLCGPPPMMEALVPALEDQGVAAENIHYESFGPASLTRRPGPAQAEPLSADRALAVRFSRSGKTVAWDPKAESLLALAEAQGIRVESGCRAGSCGGCETALESGEVSYLQSPDAYIAPGHCLLCIGKPATDLSLDL
jgi:ferredoxin-NADP reductase